MSSSIITASFVPDLSPDLPHLFQSRPPPRSHLLMPILQHSWYVCRFMFPVSSYLFYQSIYSGLWVDGVPNPRHIYICLSISRPTELHDRVPLPCRLLPSIRIPRSVDSHLPIEIFILFRLPSPSRSFFVSFVVGSPLFGMEQRVSQVLALKGGMYCHECVVRRFLGLESLTLSCI